MSVALLVKDTENAEQRLVPVATEAIFKSTWLSGAQELGLEWVELMESGFDVTSENRTGCSRTFVISENGWSGAVADTSWNG